ncbi:MAG: cupredoxin domain-containing protein [Tepidiformaceae bacterium]
MIRIRELRRARYLAPLAALALVGGTMVACGDDDDDDDNPTAAATTAVSSPAATTTTAAAQPTATATQPPATATTAAGVTIQVADILFNPDDETVPVGTEVTWQWAGDLPHSVIGEFAGEDVESEQQTSGTFRFTFESAGTFDYICGVHGQAMTGRIVVQ